MVDTDGAAAIDGGVVVVVDVLRAFTVAAWAFHGGVRELRLVADVEEAVALASITPGALLCKDGAPDPRFDLHNSPAQLFRRDVRGRTIVHRTAAGTRAAIAARRATHLYCAGFVCASASAQVVRDLEADEVTFVVSGGLAAEEDVACAEFVAASIVADVDAAPFVERAARSAAAADLRDGVRRGFAGVDPDDVSMCLDVDRFDFAMRAGDAGDHLVLRQESRRDAGAGC